MPLTLVLLLRGINVSTSTSVPMPELRSLLAGAGYADAATLLRSGNVVLSALEGQTPEAVARDAERLIAERFGFDVAVVVRTAEELAAVAAQDPFDGAAHDGSRRVVAFLDGRPDADALAAVTAIDFGPERIVAAGRELHLWYPDGQARSPMAKELSRAKLGTVVTVRNWNTVQKLLKLTGGAESR
ncbi:hypothetical protein DSM112329_04816 [Paraconexibacter sp. AEG42_29]|uniref:DUF1697 domain-containing protein n=1 Tax=Paraconexibacter sp. AEG42_29 TaxID=2997339 RepID=A0AAU7B2M3_9ACTN